ncbi:hypothetical protein V1477_001279, partial [Vespula maculifrons]
RIKPSGSEYPPFSSSQSGVFYGKSIIKLERFRGLSLAGRSLSRSRIGMKFHSATLTECFVKAKYERRAPKGRQSPATTKARSSGNLRPVWMKRGTRYAIGIWNSREVEEQKMVLRKYWWMNIHDLAPSSSSPLDVSGDQLTLPNRTSQKAISIYSPM